MALDRRAKKRIAWGIGAVLVLLLLVFAFLPSPIPVETGIVTRGPLEVTVDADGVTRVVDRFQIAAPITGRLIRITLEEGDVVMPGAILARIAPAPLDPPALRQARANVAAAEARVEEANARVVQARESMEMARRTADRVAAVVREGGMSVEAGERAELDAVNAAREFEAAQSRALAAEGDLAATRAVLVDADPEEVTGRAAVDVTSPSHGRVLRIHERSERVIPAGTPLLEIGDADRLEVVVDVLSTEAVQIATGAPMRIDDWGGSRPLSGRVRQVEPAAFTRVSSLGVEEQRVNVIGELDAPPAALGDGYRVEASIVTWQAPDVLRVPSSALFQTEDGWEVFVVDGGRARRRPVEIGHRATSETEVLNGLLEGEVVILYPSDQLEDGSRVDA